VRPLFTRLREIWAPSLIAIALNVGVGMAPRFERGHRLSRPSSGGFLASSFFFASSLLKMLPKHSVLFAVPIWLASTKATWIWWAFPWAAWSKIPAPGQEQIYLRDQRHPGLKLQTTCLSLRRGQFRNPRLDQRRHRSLRGRRGRRSISHSGRISGEGELQASLWSGGSGLPFPI